MPSPSVTQKGGPPGVGRGKSCFGGPQRTRKIKRDAIRGITKPDIRRLARRGGVKFISGTIYNDIREVLIARLKLIIDDCIKYVDYRKAKTITVQDVLFTVRRFGQPIYGFDPGTNTESSPTKKR
ncbi:Histone H4.2 like protein [Verticillium longisporum]|uniref:Histone H4.2 like protein n=1 Tax=Verticillium longisporum TaxID=100787 RepID=A0A8I3AT95_VERLO|nr:Histone H4.2 like protein [Verticillium longisporum]